MHRRRYTKALVDCGREEAIQFAEEITEKYEIEMISEPKEALVMVKMREHAQNGLFFLGEVLITECKLRIEGKVGLGLIKGNDPEFAKALAIIDAAFQSELSEVITMIPVIEALEQENEKRYLREVDMLAKTKVQFELMTD